MSSTLSPGGRGQKQDRQISQKIENFGIVWRCPYDFAHPIFLFPHKAGLDFGRQRRPKQDRPISMKHYLMGAFMRGWRCLQRVFFIVLHRPVSGRVQPWPILLTPKIMCLILFWPLLNVSFTSLQEHKTSTLFDFFVLCPQVQGAYGVIQGCQNSMRHIICGVAWKVHSFTTLCCTLWVAFYSMLKPTC